MKETAPNVNQGPPPPPAPHISKPPSSVAPVSKPSTAITELSNDIEGGEAPMDMDTKDDEALGPVGIGQGGRFLYLVSTFLSCKPYIRHYVQVVIGISGITGRISGTGDGRIIPLVYLWMITRHRHRQLLIAR